MSGLIALIFLIVSSLWLASRGIISLLNSSSKDMDKLSNKMNSVKTSKWAEKL